VRETDPVKAKSLAEDIQRRGMEITIYLPYGQFLQPTAFRDNLDGSPQVPETFVGRNGFAEGAGSEAGVGRLGVSL
jgi:hypothetical protein